MRRVMKFAVLFFTIFLSEIYCARGKGWSSASYKNEYLCPLEWGDYLKRLSLVIFMVSGVALYYVPKFRIFFHKGCHGVVDFVADGLKTALNVSETDCTSDCATSFISDRGSRLRLEKKKPLGSAFFSKLHRSKNRSKLDKNGVYYRTKEEPEESLLQKPMKLPWQTIQLYPKASYEKLLDSRSSRARAKDSGSSEGICLRPSGNRGAEISTRNRGVSSGFHESEPTNYPEDISINDPTESDESEEPDYYGSNNYSYDLKKRQKLERRLFEFDQTLRNLRSLFLRKYSRRNGSRDDFPAYLIEEILDSLKRNFTEIEEDSQKMVQRHYRRSRGIDKTLLTRGLKKIVPLNQNNHPVMTKLAKTDNHHDYRSTSPKYAKLPSNYSKNIVQATLSRKGTTVFLWDLKKR